LTGIVVGVATLGVALSVVTAIYARYDSLDEDEILKRLE
jgi:multisubunit Na+/H+ antiporter MnhC subunit